MFPPNTIPEEVLVELVGQLQECSVPGVLVDLPGSLHVGDGGRTVDS